MPVTISIEIRKRSAPPIPSRQLYRVNHDATLWRPNLPEVFPFLPNHYTRFGREYQRLEFALNERLNNEPMVKTKWRNLHLGGNQGDKATAFNNKQGFEMWGDPRADHINLRDLIKPVPKQEALVCGGGFLIEREIKDGYLYPEYIDGNDPAPSLEKVLESGLYFDAVTIDGTASGPVIRRFPQGAGNRVYILLLASMPIKISLSRVTKMDMSQPLPSPYQYP